MKKILILCLTLLSGRLLAQPVSPAEAPKKEVVYETTSPILNFDLTVDLNNINFEDIGKTEGKNYALIIAIQNYSDKNILQLDNPVKECFQTERGIDHLLHL